MPIVSKMLFTSEVIRILEFFPNQVMMTTVSMVEWFMDSIKIMSESGYLPEMMG